MIGSKCARWTRRADHRWKRDDNGAEENLIYTWEVIAAIKGCNQKATKS